MPLFQSRKPRSFSHAPVYWNPLKEKIKEGGEKAVGEKDRNIEHTDRNIKGKFVNASVHLNRKNRKAVKSTWFYRGLLFSWITLFLTIFYFVFFN